MAMAARAGREELAPNSMLLSMDVSREHRGETHQPELYLNVWLSAPPRPNPERNWSGISNAAGCPAAVLWRDRGKDP